LQSKATVESIIVSRAEIIGAFNIGFENVNPHRPTLTHGNSASRLAAKKATSKVSTSGSSVTVLGRIHVSCNCSPRADAFAALTRSKCCAMFAFDAALKRMALYVPMVPLKSSRLKTM